MSKLLNREDEAIVTCVVCRNLLEQPVLLGCLHNACSPCIGDISSPAAPGSGHGRGEQGLMSVTCPRCKETHNMDAKSLNRTNMHVAARIAVIQTELQQANKYCSVCRESRLGELPATHSCPECRLLLCDDCTRDHARFLRGHPVVAVSAADDAQEPSVEAVVAKIRECCEHGKPLSYYCKTCESLACTVCIQLKCSREEHRFAPAEAVCEEAKKELMAAVDRVTSSPGLRLVREHAARSKSLLGELQAARRSQLEALQQRREEAMRGITEVYERAERRMREFSQLQQEEALERMVTVAVTGDESTLPEMTPVPPIVAECVQSMEEMLAKFIDSIRITNLTPGIGRSDTSDSSQPPSSQ